MNSTQARNDADARCNKQQQIESRLKEEIKEEIKEHNSFCSLKSREPIQTRLRTRLSVARTASKFQSNETKEQQEKVNRGQVRNQGSSRSIERSLAGWKIDNVI